MEQNSLIHQKIRKAAFVTEEPKKSDRLIYKIFLLRSKYVSDKLIGLKRFFNSQVQFIQKEVKNVKWKALFSSVSVWITEAFIEGLTANFATHYLLGLDFNMPIILAHGIVIKQGIDIYWRLRRNGEHKRLPLQN